MTSATPRPDALAAGLVKIARRLNTTTPPDVLLSWIEQAEALLRDQQRQPAGWRPIETAPKDGTRVLIWFDGQARIAAWCKTSHIPLYGWNLVDQGPEDCEMVGPAHWQSLPEPPLPTEQHQEPEAGR